MRKLLSYLWLPITAGILLIILYGSLTIIDLKNQNQNLNQNQKQLEKKIVNLDNKFNQLISASEISSGPEKVAGWSSSTAPSVETNQDTQTGSDNQENEPTPKPTPLKTKSASQTSTSYSPTPAPTPTPISSPTIIPVAKATVSIEQVGEFTVNLTDDDTAFTILLRAGEENDFTVGYQMYDFGVFVSGIAGIIPAGNQYWAFYYNNAYSMVGASAQPVKDGDVTSWKLETF